MIFPCPICIFGKKQQYIHIFFSKNPMSSYKNILFLVLWGSYFLFYTFFPSHNFFWFFTNGSFLYSEVVFSYFNALIAFLVVVGLVSLLYKIIRSILLKIFQKTENKFDDLALQIMDSFIFPIKYVAAFSVITKILILPNNVSYIVDHGTRIIFLFLVLLFVTKLINTVFSEWLIEKSKLKAISKSLLPFVNKVIVAVIWVIWIITILSNLWYDVTALIAGAWIWGIAIALAAQKSIANIFGAITILMNKPFKIWDYVVINGITGTVKDIGLSYLTLVSKEWHQVMIPNETIISTHIENQTVRKYRRADFSIGLVYDTSLKQMEKWVKIVEEILEKYVVEKKLQSYRVNFEAFGDFSLNIFITYFSGTNNYTDFVKEKEEINLEIKKLFWSAKLEMAFPTSEMIIKKWDL